jgi:sec-independent protein translocase protein TatC
MKKYILEIKNRVLLVLLSYFSILLTIYSYKDVLLFTIIKPKNIFYNKFNLFYFIFTDVTEIFYVYFKLIFFLSFQITIIIVFYHFLLFLSTALYQSELRYLKLIFIFFSLLSLFSFLIAYFIVIPLSWDFFLSFQELLTKKSFTIHFEAKFIEYFNFYISLYYVCGIYFQLFGLLFFILNYVNHNYKNLQKFRKIFYFVFISFSAFICPELVSQIIISIVFILIYEIFLFVYIYQNSFFIQVAN